jgi:cytoskeletal protein CcmA (bactofilin family)
MVKEPTINLGKAKGRRTLDKVEGFATTIGPEAHFIGTIDGKGHYIVHGRVEGDCNLNGTLVIGEHGVWQGDIVAENILVAGRIEGAVRARDKMEMISTAHIQGSLTAPIIAIAEGAIHEGEVQMGEVRRFTAQRQSD